MHDEKWFKSVTRIIVDVVTLVEVLYFYSDVGHRVTSKQEMAEIATLSASSIADAMSGFNASLPSNIQFTQIWVSNKIIPSLPNPQ